MRTIKMKALLIFQKGFIRFLYLPFFILSFPLTMIFITICLPFFGIYLLHQNNKKKNGYSQTQVTNLFEEDLFNQNAINLLNH